MRREILYKTDFLRNSSSLFQWLLYKANNEALSDSEMSHYRERQKNQSNTVYFSIHDNTHRS